MSDILIKNGFIITMNKDYSIISNGSIYINGDKIIAIDKDEVISKDYSTAEYTINAKHKVVLPGFVNTHAHLPAHHLRGVYGRGIGGLYNITFPITKYIDVKDSYIYAVASCAEALYAGSTTVVATHRNDTKDFNDFIKAVEKTGLRVICGEIIPEADLYKLKNDVYEYKPDVANKALRRTIDLFNKWNGGLDGKVHVILAPHAPDITTAETYLKCKEASEKYGMNITTHLSQSWQEVMQVKKVYGKTPPQLLYDLKLMNERLTVTHCTYTTEHDTMLIRDSGAKILHCRSVTNPLNKWLDMGIPVGLGTDDVFHSMNELLRENIMGSRFRAKMDGGAAERIGDRPTTSELLQLSTIKGAEVMDVDSEVGSLEPGKKADIITFNMENPLLTPTIDPLASIVLYATASDIDIVIVNGKIIKKNGVFANFDLTKTLYDAQEKIFEIWKKFIDEDPEIKSNLSKIIPHLAV